MTLKSTSGWSFGIALALINQSVTFKLRRKPEVTALKTTEEDDKEEVAEEEFKKFRVDAAVEAVFIRTGWYFRTKRRKKKGTGRLFLVEKMFTLYSRLILVRV